MVLVKNGRRPDEITVAIRSGLSVHKATGTHPPSQRRSPTPGGRGREERPRSARYPMDDVRQVRTKWDVGR